MRALSFRRVGFLAVFLSLAGCSSSPPTCRERPATDGKPSFTPWRFPSDSHYGAIAIDPAGKIAATADSNGCIVTWSLPDGAPVGLVRASGPGVYRVWLPLPGLILWIEEGPKPEIPPTLDGSAPSFLKLVAWDLELNTIRYQCDVNGWFGSVALRSDGKLLISATPDHAEAWDVRTGAVYPKIGLPIKAMDVEVGGPGSGRELQFESYAFCVDDQGSLVQWHVGGGHCLQPLDTGIKWTRFLISSTSYVESILVTPTQFAVWNHNEKKIVRTYPIPDGDGEPVSAVVAQAGQQVIYSKKETAKLFKYSFEKQVPEQIFDFSQNEHDASSAEAWEPITTIVADDRGRYVLIACRSRFCLFDSIEGRVIGKQ